MTHCGARVESGRRSIGSRLKVSPNLLRRRKSFAYAENHSGSGLSCCKVIARRNVSGNVFLPAALARSF